MNSTPDYLNAKATVSVFAGVMAIILAIIYVTARIGFEQYPLLVVQVLALSLLFVCFPTTYLLLVPRFRIHPGSSWFTSDTAVSVAVVGLVILTAFLPPMPRSILLALFTVIGLGCFGFVLISWFQQGERKHSIFFLIFIAIFTVWIAGRWMAWRGGYQNPLFEEKIALRAVHHDTLIHAAVSSMIQTYGIPSTGLDGIPYFPYHTGSHWFMAQLSTLLGTYPLRLYQLGFPLIFYPLFFSSLLGFAVNLQDFLSPLVEGRRQLPYDDKVFWLLFLLANGWCIPLSVKETVAMWDLHLVSESYLLGLAWMFLVFSLSISFFRTTLHAPRSPRGEMLFLLLFPFLLSIMGFLKISLMVLCFVAAGYLFIRLRYFQRRRYLVAFLLTSIVCIATYYATKYPYGDTLRIVPFDFLRYVQIVPLFFILPFGMSWLLIFWRLRQLNVRTLLDLRNAWSSNAILDLELVVIFCIVGVAPGFTLSIPGGGACYFSDVQRWVATGLLLGSTGILTQPWSRRLHLSQPSSIWNIPLSHVLLVALVSIFAISFFREDMVKPLYQSLRENVRLRTDLMGKGNPAIQASLLRGEKWYRKFLLSTPYQRILEEQESYHLITTLRNLREMGREEKRKTLLFIPYTNTSYWNHPATARHCYDRPFLAPAVAGLAMVAGLPPAGCDYPPFYGFLTYARHAAYHRGDTIADLCIRAQQLGFSRIIELKDARTAITCECDTTPR